MQGSEPEFACPLERLSEEELKRILRGFPEAAISSALALREDFTSANLEACLFGIFLFYLPDGAEAPNKMPPGPIRLQRDLGLDSLSLSEAMFKIEELFAIRIEHAEVAAVTTLAEASDLLVEKLKGAAPKTE